MRIKNNMKVGSVRLHTPPHKKIGCVHLSTSKQYQFISRLLLFLAISKLDALILRLKCGSYADFKAIEKDRKLAQPFLSLRGYDVQMCKAECIKHSVCKSFNFNHLQGTCELHNKSAGDHRDYVATDLHYGWMYYSTWYSELLVSISSCGGWGRT